MQSDGMRDSQFQEIIEEIRRFADTAPDLASLQDFCVLRISESLPCYDWVGFYMLDENDPGVLKLGPYRGAPTEHVRIPITEGICGAAVAQREIIVVDDVRADPRYLACSVETKSEIVVPIRANGDIVGEIDVDSHTPRAFGQQDREFLERGAAIVGEYITGHRA